MKAHVLKRILNFKIPAGTSRGVLQQKPSWYIILEDELDTSFKAIGECSIIPGLSIDKEDQIESILKKICDKIQNGIYNISEKLPEFPAIQFGLETAFLDYQVRGSNVLFPSKFTDGIEGIPINGLIWMGDKKSVYTQIENKLKNGFHCIKLKIGLEDFEQKFSIIKVLRTQFNKNDLEIRTDANGAYSFGQAKIAMQMLSELDVHSVEQPIAPKQHEQMAQLCSINILPIALDEELIGISDLHDRQLLIESLNPQFLILKPSLLGGLKEAHDWIELAEKSKIGWWITSALESNIGLNAIAQWAYSENVKIPQGLGTGSLYQQNINSPLTVVSEKLFYLPDKKWNYEFVY